MLVELDARIHHCDGVVAALSVSCSVRRPLAGTVEMSCQDMGHDDLPRLLERAVQLVCGSGPSLARLFRWLFALFFMWLFGIRRLVSRHFSALGEDRGYADLPTSLDRELENRIAPIRVRCSRSSPRGADVR